MVWNIDMGQAVDLLRFRCRVIEFDDPIDDAELSVGSPRACVPILRFLFVRYSEVLSAYLARDGHRFNDGGPMSDLALVRAVLDAWPLVSPHQAIGAATAAKFLRAGSWGTDRLLFTLQAVLVCAKKHSELMRKETGLRDDADDAGWFGDSSMSWSASAAAGAQSEAGGKSEAIRSEGTLAMESESTRSTMAWMAEAYREQLDSVACSSPQGSKGSTIGNGADEQAKWVAALRNAHRGVAAGGPWETGPESDDGLLGSTPSPSSPDSSYRPSPESFVKSSTVGGRSRNGRLLPSQAQAAYEEQLARAGVAHLINEPTPGHLRHLGGTGGMADSADVADDYHARMQALTFGDGDGLEEDDGFDDEMLNTPFITHGSSDSALLSNSATRRSSDPPLLASSGRDGRRDGAAHVPW